jgi:hypothetical protein
VSPEPDDIADEETPGQATHPPGQPLKWLEDTGALLYVDHDRPHVGEDTVEDLQVSLDHLERRERSVLRNLSWAKTDQSRHLPTICRVGSL